MILPLIALGQAAMLPADAMSLPTPDLAARIFATPPASLVSHAVEDGAGAGGVRFYAAAERYGDGMCHRSAWYVPAAVAAAVLRGAPRVEPTRQEQLALAADCASVPAESFAWVQPARDVASAAVALRWIAARQVQEDSDGITCLPSHLTPDPCAAGVRIVLRTLPLARTYLINRGREAGSWDLSVMPKGPGQAFYAVRLARDATGRPVARIQWDVPPPF